jgi:DNA-binding HxlR family transcriptional regulator
MVKSGLIQRKIHSGNPARVDYSLTDKGRGLLPVLEQMAAFSMRFCSEDVIIDGKPRFSTYVTHRGSDMVENIN